VRKGSKKKIRAWWGGGIVQGKKRAEKGKGYAGRTRRKQTTQLLRIAGSGSRLGERSTPRKRKKGTGKHYHQREFELTAPHG